ncbi:MAG: enoyl-CoA hydratase/isomerase family protein [Flavobacteriales bacterium]|nr:enoyl-CoA hydratase/isomerase family protein [Flavobacteriales bacterium]MCB9180806.1 enoyl-CoA hydratase/isomerase family protein [Flavobacteriales bacterium]HPF68001.1 enoyl-CoA hydratase-related protein [Flavobacteriales bacterium]
MDNGYVKTDIAEGIATVTFHHPKSNSLPGTILRAMAQAIEDAGKDPEVRVIVLRSEGGKAFCAGASFDELLAIDDADTGREFFSGFALVINAIRKAPVFVIGRVHSKAVGGGVGLAAACDITYAHESASARLSELAIGIGPFVVGPAVERKVGHGPFTLMSTTPATWRSAAWCQLHGLYAEVFGLHAELDNAVLGHARELAGYSRDAMTELKRVAWLGTELWDELLAERAVVSGRLVLSDFTSQAIAAFKEARK